MVISPAFWKNKKVFLTGHTGFKGSWLSLWLQKLGAELTGYSLPPPTNPSLYELAWAGKHMRSIEADVRDADRLGKSISTCQPDIVIHLAAQSLVLPSYADPLTTYATNIMGTVNLLEATRHCGSVRVVINVTSDKCYENHGGNRGFSESDPMGGFDPYSSSKGCAELVTSAYRHSFYSDAGHGNKPVATATARAGNVIGGGDWSPYRLIPDIMQAFIAHRTAVIRNPEATRPWQHVLEPLGGYLRLAECMWQDTTGYSEAWNFGPDEKDTRAVSWIADELVRLWGGEARWETDSNSHPKEATSLRLDCSKAKSRLGWAPRLDLLTALTWTVEWFKSYDSGSDMRLVTEKQIDRCQNMDSHCDQ
ncbi:MAG: CDP-glucose 4,6-dehydratase [Sulfuricaulis sp.]|uniref:CDP-glucose 4,6-dehydratase n=1 Tax=Sulfuricaulis sp. TaxID=2003553 RepID=UPI0025CD53E2|nr:CDP-glucose 4,6-dehydratase [Sulfuricaulis sp.]MCR4346783.1 CDP-glucose 4,6-dehydratase [Sulfuricaulis sp.]